MEVNNNQQPVWQPSKKNRILSGAAAAGIALAPSAYVLSDAVAKTSDKKMKATADAIKMLMPEVDSFENIKKYAQDALKDTGLGPVKGVKIKFVNSSNVDEVTKEIAQLAKKQPFGMRIAQKFGKMFEFGANAAYVPENKTIYIGEKGAYSSVFHELGHAMNRNATKVMKYMQKARCLTPYGVPAAGLALFAASLFHTIKPESSEKPKSGWEKTKDFIKNNAGKITFATYLPMLIEEAAASVKGIKMAKKYLDPSQISRLSKNYRNAFGTYALTAVGLSAAIGLANMVSRGFKKPEKNA